VSEKRPMPRGDLGNYLWKVAKNYVIDALKREDRQRREAPEAYSESVDMRRRDSDELSHALHAALKKLAQMTPNYSLGNLKCPSYVLECPRYIRAYFIDMGPRRKLKTLDVVAEEFGLKLRTFHARLERCLEVLREIAREMVY